MQRVYAISAGRYCCCWFHSAVVSSVVDVSLCLQIVGICKPKPLSVDPIDVLNEEGKGIGPVLRQLSKIQVIYGVMLHRRFCCGHHDRFRQKHSGMTTHCTTTIA